MRQENIGRWELRDFLLLCIIPLELLIGSQLTNLPGINNSTMSLVVSSVLLFIVGCLVAVYLFRDFLASEWRIYKEKIWRNIAITMVLAGSVILFMRLVNALMPASVGAEDGTVQSTALLVISVIPAVIAAFVEELTFRHVLFGKIQPKLLKFVMFFISSILFGLVHWNNVGGDWVQTIPYMAMGAYFAMIYYVSKNIWYAILTHLFYNSALSLLPLLVLAIVNLLGIN